MHAKSAPTIRNVASQRQNDVLGSGSIGSSDSAAKGIGGTSRRASSPSSRRTSASSASMRHSAAS